MNNDLAPPPSPGFGHRFLGGPPIVVLIRLVFVSLVVGALLMWLRVEPLDLLQAFVRTAERIWNMGFDALGDLGRYVLAGAVIVVPIWIVVRVLSFRGIR